MTKTPEQMAEDYADDWHKDCDYPAEILRHTKKATETVFLAGYKAGCTNTQSELAVGREVVEFLLKKPQWISVKERLPENGIEVLVVSDGETGASWHEKGEFGWAIGGTVTHWMPLPEPPEEEK